MVEKKAPTRKESKKGGRRGRGEGSIYQRKDGRWVASVVLGSGERESFYDFKREIVAEWLTKKLYEKQQGLLATGPRQTTGQFLLHWLENVHKIAVRESTYEMNKCILMKHLLPAFGTIQLRKLSADDIQHFYAKKTKEGMSARYLRIMHNLLHKALKYAERTRRIVRNVSELVDLPRIVKPKRQALTAEQVRQLFHVAQGWWLESLLILAVTSGMRRGELLALHWEDIDFTKKYIDVRRAIIYIPKKGYLESETKTTQSERRVVLTDFAVQALLAHRVQQKRKMLETGHKWSSCQLVFCDETGGYVRFSTLVYQFAALLKAADLPKICFHELRHTVATLLEDLDVSISVRQEILGHATPAQTLGTYTHVRPEKQREAIEKLNRLFVCDA